MNLKRITQYTIATLSMLFLTGCTVKTELQFDPGISIYDAEKLVDNAELIEIRSEEQPRMNIALTSLRIGLKQDSHFKICGGVNPSLSTKDREKGIEWSQKEVLSITPIEHAKPQSITQLWLAAYKEREQALQYELMRVDEKILELHTVLTRVTQPILSELTEDPSDSTLIKNMADTIQRFEPQLTRYREGIEENSELILDNPLLQIKVDTIVLKQSIFNCLFDYPVRPTSCVIKGRNMRSFLATTCCY
ncbi:MAG: hypothetical protein AAF564_16315 [Bacteroidota bacterium]